MIYISHNWRKPAGLEWIYQTKGIQWSMLGGPVSTQLGLHIIIKPLWSAAAVININELWAVLQVYQCCTRSFIRPTHLQIHSWQDSALSELTSPHLRQLQRFPPPLFLSSPSKLTPPLAVTHSTVRLPATAMSSRIPKIDLFIPVISFKKIS